MAEPQEPRPPTVRRAGRPPQSHRHCLPIAPSARSALRRPPARLARSRTGTPPPPPGVQRRRRRRRRRCDLHRRRDRRVQQRVVGIPRRRQTQRGTLPITATVATAAVASAPPRRRHRRQMPVRRRRAPRRETPLPWPPPPCGWRPWRVPAHAVEPPTARRRSFIVSASGRDAAAATA